ncbi:MAG: LTA synthase family protein [Bacteroidota bacterium]
MRNNLLSFLKQWLYWFLLFALGRLVFLIWNHNMLAAEHISFGEIAKCFYFALKLDVSAACYLSLLPYLLHSILYFKPSKYIYKIHQVYVIIISIIVYLIALSETGIYSEWKSKLNTKALAYLQNPTEIVSSTSTFNVIGLLLILVLLIVGSVLLFNKVLPYKKHPFKKNIVWGIIFALCTPLLLLTGIRGGWQAIPITQSQSWYSRFVILNDAAVNPTWNLFVNILSNQQFLKHNPFESMPDADAKKIVDQIHHIKQDTTINILTTNRPNVVLIIMESWSADLIESLGGEKGITPQFHELEKEGYLFTQAYSSGNRSQQGMAGFFGGFPALPITTLTEHPDKYVKVPSLIKILNANKYNTSFYFGGQLIYGNIKSFIMFNEFNRIIEGEQFDSKIPRGKLGVHDEYLFARQLNDLKAEAQPFFSAMFTLSTHSPYDEPMQKVLNWGGNECDYINSAYYTDQCLGNYIAEAKKQPWFNNTLFIISADHSHNTYRNYNLQTFEYHKIPIFLYGNVLKPEYRGKQSEVYISQSDIPSTLLHQLNIPSTQFEWSRNIFNPYMPQFAYFEMNDGLGWKRPDGYFVYNKLENVFLDNKLPPAAADSMFKEGKAYLQHLFREFIDF